VSDDSVKSPDWSARDAGSGKGRVPQSSVVNGSNFWSVERFMCLLQNECGDLVGQEALRAADVCFTSANQPIHLHAQLRAILCADTENHLVKGVEVPGVLAWAHIEWVYTKPGLAGLACHPGYGFNLRMELETTLAARAGSSEVGHTIVHACGLPFSLSFEESFSEFCD